MKNNHTQLETDIKSGIKLGNPESIVEKYEQLLAQDIEISNDIWFDFLDKTSRNYYLTALSDETSRNRWAELVFKIIQKSDYHLADMFQQRLNEQPAHVLFQDRSRGKITNWTYEQVNNMVREFAAVFHTHEHENPRLALFAANSVETAATDMACLFYDIFVSPLNIHFNTETLVYIFDQLNFNIAVTDTEEHYKKLLAVREKTKTKFFIYCFDQSIATEENTYILGKEAKKLNYQRVNKLLSDRKRLKLNEVATTMFTSGSTGMPKGVSFSIYNLVSKRFARHAALPKVGTNEVLLCFLPLFHTFGRYLEMLGSIYWRGTYVFTGNPSTETLLKLFPEVNPTGFISVPIRWAQLYEKSIDNLKEQNDPKLREEILRKVVGQNLRWGLSAAGYLSPKTFRFFHDNDIALCSGFGMTEATGGITMTPPDDYYDNSTGKPLPGIKARLKPNDELELCGHYVAQYLTHAGPGDIIAYPTCNDQDYWIATGDIFKIHENGHYEIVDRVKDIYKNNKGQTVAPRMIEQKFAGVPGIKHTFLVGDARPYNVLLIVPDPDDPVLQACGSEDNQKEYFHQIVTTANKDVAPYERVINFAILDRDFSLEKGELTPKGSFNRKTIEKNSQELIKSLYQRNHIYLQYGAIELVIPRWFYRDLGILEDDIILNEHGLYNKRSKIQLHVACLGDNNYMVGNLMYTSEIPTLDIGRFARQPRLWLGNPELIDFCPVKEGWDLPLKSISSQVSYPKDNKNKSKGKQFTTIKGIRDHRIVFINNLIINSLFANTAIAKSSTEQLGELFTDSDDRMAEVIRRRLEALSCHRKEEIRTLAYRILLLNDPNPDYTKTFPTFVRSGLSFLNEASIQEIAISNLGKKHLESLRKRLYIYRKQLSWPADANTFKQFDNILKLLYNFGSRHLEYYKSIRAELAAWILHKSAPKLSALAEKYFHKLYQDFENHIENRRPVYSKADWDTRIVFEYGMPTEQRQRIRIIFEDTVFLEQSIFLAFNEHNFEIEKVAKAGIWVTRLQSFNEYRHYRITMNTNKGKHYNLHMVMSRDADTKTDLEDIYWISSIAEFPFDLPTLPPLGCSRAHLGVRTSQYVDGLTVWEKIREFSEIHQWVGNLKENSWKKLFIKGLAVFFRALKQSSYKIVPGAISPHNVVVPEMDFRESATIVTLTGYRHYQDSLSIIEPIIKNFYNKTIALYPWCKEQLDPQWILDAAMEGLGSEDGIQFIEQLAADITDSGQGSQLKALNLTEKIGSFLEKIKSDYYFNQMVFDAIAQYREWENVNPLSTPTAKEQTIFELMELYKIHRYKDVARYYFYRHTYFDSLSSQVQQRFDILLDKMIKNPDAPPVQFIELSDLQSELDNDTDKNIFSKMVFPRLQRQQKVDFLKIGETNKEQVIVRTHLTDKNGINYLMREPIEASEVGQLYQLFFEENYPKTISKMDKHLVVTDRHNRVIGGLCYKILENNIILLDGSAITSPLQGKGIGSAMIEDFFTRMSSHGFKIIKAHFLFGNYYLKHNFKVDKKWGALVKYLD